MNSPEPKTTTPMSNSLSAQLQQIGLCAVPAQLDDFIARATKARWSAHQILEQVVQTEAAERSRRSLERRLRMSGIKSFKPIADFDWSWPTKPKFFWLREGKSRKLNSLERFGRASAAYKFGIS
jgi:hypothetical protein